MRLIAFAAVSAMALCAVVPALGQGAKTSSTIELAEAVNGLKPGTWVWAPQISSEGPLTVLVDLTAQLAFVYRNGVNIGVSTVSSGKPGHETPTGVFTILQKDANHHSSKYNNAPMFFQERLTWDGVALHAGGLPGYPEGHGCVHLPYTFTKELFKITSMGGTVVVTGRAGAPEKARAGGVLAPIEEGGGASAHNPLEGNAEWRWDEADALDGPVPVVISTTDQRIAVLKSGQEVGRAKAVVEGDRAGTRVATLHTGSDGKPHWMLLGVPGHEGEANHALDATVLERLRLPRTFHQRLVQAIKPGATILVTSASVGAHNSGRQLTLFSATDTVSTL